MKTLKVLLLAVAFTFSGALSASTEPVKKTAEKSNEISKTVSKLLENPSFQIDDELNAMIILTVNQENEIVVLSVDSDHETLESYIKNRLNYEKLDTDFSGKQKTYKVPVKVKSI
ncbi:hypothetical protein [Winogradskyella aurantiaca]|uniref:hypothetical protein n=1 Tax=Winogradskyella aurantiaca TaxID=2219558 RepID=UPI000E1D032B|nr:hypothetical protein [Winogradskyella aurantiaca]